MPANFFRKIIDYYNERKKPVYLKLNQPGSITEIVEANKKLMVPENIVYLSRDYVDQIKSAPDMPEFKRIKREFIETLGPYRGKGYDQVEVDELWQDMLRYARERREILAPSSKK